MKPLDIQDRVAAVLRRQHKPEGISVMVKWPAGITFDRDLLARAGMALAATEYPGELTGQVLHLGLDEFGAGVHEVVLEVK